MAVLLTNVIVQDIYYHSLGFEFHLGQSFAFFKACLPFLSQCRWDATGLDRLQLESNELNAWETTVSQEVRGAVLLPAMPLGVAQLVLNWDMDTPRMSSFSK